MTLLENEHIQSITNLVNEHRIKYLDVRFEIIDHIASAVESEWQAKPEGNVNEIIRIEKGKWSVQKMNDLVNSKKHHLYWGWYRRMFRYLISYFRLPKIAILISLTAAIYFFLLSYPNLENSLDFISKTTFGLYFLGIFYSLYKSIVSTFTDWNELLTIYSYNKTVTCLPMIPHVLILIITTSISDQLIPTNLHVLSYSFGLSISLILVHAFLFVFPKMLKRDTLQYYAHLNTAL